jgi:hypothetical protein
MAAPRDPLTPGAVLSEAGALTGSGRPPLRALWRPRGPPVLMPTPGPPSTRSGLGAVTSQTGETVGLFRRRKRRQEVAARVQAPVDQHPTGPVDATGDHAATQAAEEVEALVRAAAGRLVLLSGPTDSPRLNPVARRWRPCRRAVPHCALFPRLAALRQAAQAFGARGHRSTARVVSRIGAHAASLSWVYLARLTSLIRRSCAHSGPSDWLQKNDAYIIPMLTLNFKKYC